MGANVWKVNYEPFYDATRDVRDFIERFFSQCEDGTYTVSKDWLDSRTAELQAEEQNGSESVKGFIEALKEELDKEGSITVSIS